MEETEPPKQAESVIGYIRAATLPSLGEVHTATAFPRGPLPGPHTMQGGEDSSRKAQRDGVEKSVGRVQGSQSGRDRRWGDLQKKEGAPKSTCNSLKVLGKPLSCA